MTTLKERLLIFLENNADFGGYVFDTEHLLTFIKQELMLLAEEMRNEMGASDELVKIGINRGLYKAASIIRTRADEI